MAEKTAAHAKGTPADSTAGRPPPSRLAPTQSLARSLLHLQGTAGNQAVGRLLSIPWPLVQAQLRIGQPGDAFEREADRVADAVAGPATPPGRLPGISLIHGASGGALRRCARCGGDRGASESRGTPAGAAPGVVQRKCQCAQAKDDELMQRREAPSAAPGVPAGFTAQLAGLRGGGTPLSPAQRGFFEPRFGHDFSAVRLHTGALAESSADAVHARAFTLSKDIVFGHGEYAPDTPAGRHLLAHELTHVVQQTPLIMRQSKKQQLEDPKSTSEPVYGPFLLQEVIVTATGNLAGQPLTDADRQNAAKEAGSTPPAGPLAAFQEGPRFVLHDTAGPTRSLSTLQALGRRSSGEGPAAYVPRDSPEVMAHPTFFSTRRPTATKFEAAAELMKRTDREDLYRRVWRATGSKQREAALDGVLTAQGSDKVKVGSRTEAAVLKGEAIAQLSADSGDVWSAAVWSVEDICKGGASMAAKGMQADLEAACNGLAEVNKHSIERIGSSTNVEIVQEEGSNGGTEPPKDKAGKSHYLTYSDNQYQGVKRLYLRAALEVGRFPEITTHFLIDKKAGNHFDPRCFNLGHLYSLVSDALHHHKNSSYGIEPSYGPKAADNVWWVDKVCGGSHP
jgi:hypothetical protein